MSPLRKSLLRMLGYFTVSILTGLVVYQTPPESWGQLYAWLWQPALTGALDAVLSLSVNSVVKFPTKAP